MTWQPIETAPKNTREMFVVIGVGIQHFSDPHLYTTDPWCVWRYESGSFARWPHPFAPTHWMPLPPPPGEST